MSGGSELEHGIIGNAEIYAYVGRAKAELAAIRTESRGVGAASMRPTVLLISEPKAPTLEQVQRAYGSLPKYIRTGVLTVDGREYCFKFDVSERGANRYDPGLKKPEVLDALEKEGVVVHTRDLEARLAQHDPEFLAIRGTRPDDPVHL
jgi:hypothetical protein